MDLNISGLRSNEVDGALHQTEAYARPVRKKAVHFVMEQKMMRGLKQRAERAEARR
jgi:hypothetical protein